MSTDASVMQAGTTRGATRRAVWSFIKTKTATKWIITRPQVLTLFSCQVEDECVATGLYCCAVLLRFGTPACDCLPLRRYGIKPFNLNGRFERFKSAVAWLWSLASLLCIVISLPPAPDIQNAGT